MKKPVIAVLIGSMFLSGCSSTVAETSVVETSVIETTVIEVTEETSAETTEETVIEPIVYECPIDYSTSTINVLDWVAANRENSYGYFLLFNLGFDNPYLRENIINNTYEITGVYDDSLVVDNFFFFQRLGLEDYIVDTTPSDYTSFLYENDAIIRTIMSRLGLRYCIDEIPWYFIEQNFSEFAEASVTDNDDFYSEIGVYYPDPENYVDGDPLPDDYNNIYLYEFNEATSMDNFYTSIICYNRFVLGMGLIPYSGVVDIVRNPVTGGIEMDYAEHQYTRLHDRMVEISPAYDFDFYQVETEEQIEELCGIEIDNIPYINDLDYTIRAYNPVG